MIYAIMKDGTNEEAVAVYHDYKAFCEFARREPGCLPSDPVAFISKSAAIHGRSGKTI